MNAMAGADSAMHMYTVMASGKEFEEAFEFIYGISWNDAKSIFAEYVSLAINDLFSS